MDTEILALASGLVPRAYISQAEGALNARRKLLKSLISQRSLPLQGWDEISIELLLQEMASMDSNNFIDNIGVGEREARVACPLVRRRHYGMAHGVGRSGDIAAVQPKAAGSSLLAKLTNLLVLDALKIAGMVDISAASVLPLATGMALTSVLLALKRTRPSTARYVLWSRGAANIRPLQSESKPARVQIRGCLSGEPRIDQKTCVKCVVAAGLELVVIPLVLQGEQLCTDMACLTEKVHELGCSQIVAVLSTTSCFAPRAADDIVAIAKLCREKQIGHVVNNAYGVQAQQLCKLVASAWRKGRVDAVVQSTDKNFMVPVGGSVIAAGPGKADFIDAVNAAYPGRASAAPMLDLLMTLLFWGKTGWQSVLKYREELYSYCQTRLEEFALHHGFQLLETPGNPISLALSLDRLSQGIESPAPNQAAQAVPKTHVGSMLFSRCVSGTRVIARGVEQKVAGLAFKGYGAHYDNYPHNYLTLAAAIGTSRADIDTFLVRLGKVMQASRRKQEKGA